MDVSGAKRLNALEKENVRHKSLADGAGSDELTGGAGADLFVFSCGRDMIEDFRPEDTMQIVASLRVTNFAGILARVTVTGGSDDDLISFGGGNSLRLEDVQLSWLSGSDFVFV